MVCRRRGRWFERRRLGHYSSECKECGDGLHVDEYAVGFFDGSSLEHHLYRVGRGHLDVLLGVGVRYPRLQQWKLPELDRLLDSRGRRLRRLAKWGPLRPGTTVARASGWTCRYLRC